MPDGAFEATERQFVGLLDAGSGCETIEVSRHTMAGVPRGDRAADRIAEEYAPIGEIIENPPDLLIVTGSNPLEARIEDEPYWADLVALLSWGRDNVPSMLLSCLSAHAALAVFEGIERTRLTAKCTGVFPQQADPAHPLAAGLAAPIVLPHSRLNAVAESAVRAAGYRVALGSEAVGWSVITKVVWRHRGGPGPGAPRIRSVQPGPGVPPRCPALRARRTRRCALPSSRLRGARGLGPAPAAAGAFGRR